MSFRQNLPFAAALLFLGACTDIVELDSTFEGAQPVVDAWLTDKSETQTIYLYQTQDYYVEALNPRISGAEVVVCSGTTAQPSCKVFAEAEDQQGAYTWTPRDSTDQLGNVNDSFALSIVLPNDQRIGAISQLLRVPQIDSISFQFEEQQIGLDEGRYAQLYARDLAGIGDRYLIRTTVNDTLLNRADEINLAADAAFNGGTASDGIPFIQPIRFRINKSDDDGGINPVQTGDRFEVEIWSLTIEAFTYLNNAVGQIQNGDSQLFSVPVVSTRGNVFDLDTQQPVVGMFSVSAVSRAEREVPAE